MIYFDYYYCGNYTPCDYDDCGCCSVCGKNKGQIYLVDENTEYYLEDWLQGLNI